MEDGSDHLTIGSYEVYHELVPMEEIMLPEILDGVYELNFEIDIDVDEMFGELDEFMDEFDSIFQ